MSQGRHGATARFPGLAAVALLIAIGAALGGCWRPPPMSAPAPDTERPLPARSSSEALAPSAPAATVIVRHGDSIHRIARTHQVAIRGLIEINRLAPPYGLVVGQVLKLPPRTEYMVRKGDTVYRISRCHGVDMATLTRLNGIVPPYTIAVGQRLRLPPVSREPACPAKVSEPPAADVVARPQARTPETQEPATARAASSAIPKALPGPVPKPPARASTRFLWPVSGKLISSFGAKPGNRHNDGVNIAAGAGSPVRAAENGVVVYVGNELRGYGNLILIRHADGWTSAYAHNQAILVGRGATVGRGQVIAEVGRTGNVASPQTHFELRRGSKAVDPVTHLSWQ